jgi:hypothetical protein
VAGDEKYGDPTFNETLRALGLTRMFLHAHSLSFSWPRGGEFSINTPLPAELAALIDRLAAQRGRARGASLKGARNPLRAAPRRAKSAAGR